MSALTRARMWRMLTLFRARGEGEEEKRKLVTHAGEAGERATYKDRFLSHQDGRHEVWYS